jgi:hypothetical protein
VTTTWCSISRKHLALYCLRKSKRPGKKKERKKKEEKKRKRKRKKKALSHQHTSPF